MLVRVYPQQLAKYWKLVKHAIKESIPDCGQEIIQNLLRELLTERAESWLWVVDAEPLCVFVIRRSHDIFAGKTSCTIVAMCSKQKLADEVYIAAFAKLRERAQNWNCACVDFFAQNNMIEQKAEEFGIPCVSRYYRLTLD